MSCGVGGRSGSGCGGAASEVEDEGKAFCKEALRQVQDCETTRRGARDLRESSAQAATGIAGLLFLLEVRNAQNRGS